MALPGTADIGTADIDIRKNWILIRDIGIFPVIVSCALFTAQTAFLISAFSRPPEWYVIGGSAPCG